MVNQHEAAMQWPEGARIAVMVTVMFEAWPEGKGPPYGPMASGLRERVVIAGVVDQDHLRQALQAGAERCQAVAAVEADDQRSDAAGR